MKKPVQSTTEKATLTTEITPQNFGTQVLSFARKTGIKVSAVLAFFALASCGSDTPIDEELNNRVQNNLTVTVGDFDNDGVKDDVRVKNVVTDLDKDDKISQTISLGDQSFQADARMLEKDFLNVPKGTAVAKAVSTDTKSEDTDTQSANVEEVEMPNVDSTVANPNVTVDENSTNDINLGVEDANGLASTVFKNESTNELATYFNLIDNTKLQVKTNTILNHEVDSQIQGVITITDALGNQIDKTITIDLNDIQEQQIIDIYGDGGLLPNGEAYAVKVDEEKAGETLPVNYYVNGTGNTVTRRTEADINADIADNTSYGSIQDAINGMHFDNTVPGYPNGEPVNPTIHQAMVSFDDTTNKEVVYASDGSELARYDRTPYSQQAQQILNEILNADSDNFRKTHTTEYDVLRDKIVADTKNPTQPNVNTDFAIKTKLTE